MSQRAPRDDRGIDVTFWKNRLDDLADVRWDKVEAVRRALGRGQYEVSSRLGRILPELHNELGVLCRQESSLGEGPPRGRADSED